MCLNDIPKASGMRHIHGVNVDFVEKRRRRVDGRWEADLGGLADLAQVTCLDVPLDVRLEGWPPEVVEEGMACGVEALVAQLVMSVADKSVPCGGAGVELVATTVLLLPKSASGYKETVHSANKMSERVGRYVRRCAPRKEELLDPLYLSVSLACLVASWKLGRCKVGDGNVGRLGGVVVLVGNGAEVVVVVVGVEVGVVDGDAVVVVVDRWCGARGVRKERSEAIGGMRRVGRDEVASAESRREAAVTVRSEECGGVVVIVIGLQGEDKSVCVKRVSQEEVKPTHDPSAKG